MTERKIRFYLGLAKLVSLQGTCPRAQVGAVIVNDDRVVSMGYNGSPRGTIHCDAGGCIMQKRGDTESCVRSVHAEMNAIINAAYNGSRTKNSVMLATHFPCINCLKAVINAGIVELHYLTDYDDTDSQNLVQMTKGIITVVKQNLSIDSPRKQWRNCLYPAKGRCGPECVCGAWREV